MSDAFPEFDRYAENYDAALAQGLSVSGEDKNYFAQRRIEWLTACLQELQSKPKFIMDFGCGTGSSSQLLLDLTGAELCLGVDQSRELLHRAQQTYGSQQKRFLSVDQYEAAEEIDLVFSSGVFHHVPVHQRIGAIDYIRRSLRVGGLFALWENNPWNPGTRYVMSRIPFDRDAVTMKHTETRQLLRAGRFEVLRTDFLFIFPKVLRSLRWIEPLVSHLPFGAQYQVLSRKI